MDSGRFDRISKSLATGVDRRGLVKGIVAGAAAAVVGALPHRSISVAAAAIDPTQCQSDIGAYCNPGCDPETALPIHLCCGVAYLTCDFEQSKLVDPYGYPIGGSCQCAPGYFDCEGSCISEILCCPTFQGAGLECTGGVCDPTSSTCVECLANEDCASAGSGTPVCNTESNTCVECMNSETDCLTGEVCNPTTHTCVDCLTNEDCAGDTPFCAIDTHVCVECVNDPDCTEGVCDSISNTCVECVGDTDCTGGEVCNAAAHSCVECVVDANCTAGEFCLTETNTCGECLSDADCALGEICSPEGACVECVNDENCLGEICSPEGVCVECVGDANCTDAAAPYCSPSSNICVECLDDANCLGERCSSEGICVECVTNTDCASGAVCTDNGSCQCAPGFYECDGVCTSANLCCPSDSSVGPSCQVGEVCSPDGTCVECVATNDCVNGEVCDSTSNTCLECVVSGDCAGGEVCDSSTNTCAECVTNDHCGTGEVCTDGGTCQCAPGSYECNGVCMSTSLCCPSNPGEGLICPDGEICSPATGTCVECLSNEDCGGGVCITETGVCVGCVSNDDCAVGEFCSDQGICTFCPEGSNFSPVTGQCISNGTCPSGDVDECAGDQQICCGAETEKPFKCVGKGQDRGNRACYMDNPTI